MTSRLIISTSILVLVAGCNAPVTNLNGRVTDRQGNGIPDVTIVFKNEILNAETTTDADGMYRISLHHDRWGRTVMCYAFKKDHCKKDYERSLCATLTQGRDQELNINLD